MPRLALTELDGATGRFIKEGVQTFVMSPGSWRREIDHRATFFIRCRCLRDGRWANRLQQRGQHHGHATSRRRWPLQQLTPPLLDHIVRRSREERPRAMQSAGDVMRELKWLVNSNHAEVAVRSPEVQSDSLVRVATTPLGSGSRTRGDIGADACALGTLAPASCPGTTGPVQD